MCNNQGLQGILLVLKNITTLIQIIVPILLIVFATISLIKLINNPEEKNGIKKIINQFIAAIIIFLIPVFVNAIMNMIGNNTTISSCWNEVSPKISLTKNYYKDNDDKRNPILQDKNDYEKGEKTTKSSLDSSNAKEIPNDVLKNASHSDLSIVVADSDGNVIAARKPDLLREGGSTVKVFTGYSAVKLLDPKNDKVVCTKYAQNMPYMGTPDVKVGQVMSVSQAATKDFPGSSNITTANIAIAIGKKKSSPKSDEEAYNNGMNIINQFLKKSGCTKTKLPSSSGVNYIYHEKKWTGNKKGISVGEYGITANDLALITINAMKDDNFSKEINYGKNGICSPPDKNSFFIKSGTQAYAHGVWGFNYKNKRYYVVILGVNNKAGDNKCSIFKDIYNWTKKVV